MAAKGSVLPLTLSTFAAGSLTTSFKAMNSSGITNSCILIRLVNDTNKDLTVSFDGVTSHDFVPAGTVLQLPFQSNLALSSGVAQLKKGTVVYIKSDASGTGNAYLSGYYQDNS